jgi:hypothetical protein
VRRESPARERGGVRVPFTEEQLAAIRGGLTAEEYRWNALQIILVPSARRKCTGGTTYTVSNVSVWGDGLIILGERRTNGERTNGM